MKRPKMGWEIFLLYFLLTCVVRSGSLLILPIGVWAFPIDEYRNFIFLETNESNRNSVLKGEEMKEMRLCSCEVHKLIRHKTHPGDRPELFPRKSHTLSSFPLLMHGRWRACTGYHPN